MSLCSCCLELCAMKSIWSEYTWNGRTEVYGDMLKECFNISWSRQRSKDCICEVCVTQLRNAVRFRRRALGCQAELVARDLGAVSSVSVEKVQHDSLLNNDNDIQDNYNQMETEPIKTEYKVVDQLTDNIQIETVPNKTEYEVIDEFYTDDMQLTAKRKLNIKPAAASKRDSVYRRRRMNACLILEHSTLIPFKSNKGYFNCFYCNKQYVSFDEMKTHLAHNHTIINFNTISKSIIRPNDRVCVDASNIVCKLCNNNITNIQELIQHLSKQHVIKFNDSLKPIDSVLPYDLSDGKFSCYQCGNEFTFFKTLAQHMNEHSTDFVCSTCGRCFLLAGRLRAHALMHVNKTSKCEICGKVCSSDVSLNSHVRYTHKKLSYLCLLCDKKFDNNRLRLEHLQLIHNRAPLNLNCKICSKKFMRIDTLNTHVRRDHLKKTKEAKYSCSECGMKFKSKYKLSNHSLVHTGVKEFECEVCLKRYARVRSLREHLKIHLNDKRWSCGTCSNSFVQKCSLKNHIRVHHPHSNVDELIVYKKPEAK